MSQHNDGFKEKHPEATAHAVRIRFLKSELKKLKPQKQFQFPLQFY